MTHKKTMFWRGASPRNGAWPKGLKAELARDMNTTLGYVVAIFSRRRRPGVKMALKLQATLASKGIGMTLDQILTGKHELFDGGKAK